MNWNYISGFFDADGYITLSKMSKNENETPVLGFTNTHKYILEKIQFFIEAQTKEKCTLCTKKSKNINHATGYDLKCVGFRKIHNIVQNFTSIHTKKLGRLELLSEIQRLTPRNGKYTKESKSERDLLVVKFLNIK
jgi:hypothetical protein